jgi:hypothetical protein
MLPGQPWLKSPYGFIKETLCRPVQDTVRIWKQSIWSDTTTRHTVYITAISAIQELTISRQKKGTSFSILHSDRRNVMWQIKEFKTKEAMMKFIENSKNKRQVEIIYINNGYAVEFRNLRRIKWKENQKRS